MSNQNANDTTPKAETLIAEVAERIAASNVAVYQRVVAAMVEKEVATRVLALDAAMQKRFTLTNELRKVDRPDDVKKDASGRVIFEAWTDARREEIKKTREALEKVDNAIEKALTTNDFSKLKGG